MIEDTSRRRWFRDFDPYTFTRGACIILVVVCVWLAIAGGLAGHPAWAIGCTVVGCTTALAIILLSINRKLTLLLRDKQDAP